MKLPLFTLVAGSLLSACALPPQPTSGKHVSEKPSATAALVPPSLRPVRLPAMPPAPLARAAQEVFSVVVNDVPVKSLLFALARDNKLNVDIHPRVAGRITLNASDQTLPQLLERMAAQTDIRSKSKGNLLRVEPDTPYSQNYSVDYVNLLRQSRSSVSVSGSLGASAGGSSSTSIQSSTENRFWDNLVSNICQVVVIANRNKSQRDEEAERLRLQERDDRLKIAQEISNMSSQERVRQRTQTGNSGVTTESNTANTAVGGPVGVAELLKQIMGNTETPKADEKDDIVSCSAAAGATGGGNSPLNVNKESGVIGINTTSKGHDRVRAFLDRVMAGARRQVLIEATVVEVQLSATSQSGINWTQIVSSGAAKGLTVNLTGSSSLAGTNAATISYANSTSALGNIAAAISLLESFGTTKVLSSPKLSVINNQTAILKVVDNYVYVTLSYTPAQLSSTGIVTSPAAYTSNINTVPVGFVMTVTPQISDSSEVTLNVHPSITRVISTIVDPNPILINATPPITNLIPVVQTRELESILRVQNGEIAVLGGLMQESSINTEQGVPGLNRVPVAGALAGQRSETRSKTELVVFMRPVVIKDASVNGDYKEYKSQLPTSAFFNGTGAEAWGAQK